MAKLFAGNAGTVAVIKNTGSPALIKIADFTYSAALVTTIGASYDCNVQIQPSLKNSIYIYSFGDNMGSIQVNGIAFMGRVCEGGAVRRNRDGVADVFEYYQKNRLSKKGAPVSIAIGSTVLSGFLISMSVSTKDVVNRFFTFTLNFAAIPPFSDLAEDVGVDEDGLASFTETDDGIITDDVSLAFEPPVNPPVLKAVPLPQADTAQTPPVFSPLTTFSFNLVRNLMNSI